MALAAMTTPDSASDATPHLYLVDGSGFIFRAYHSLPPLTRPDGTPVGAVYGFTNMLLKLREQMAQEGSSTHLAVIFDAGRKTFRNEIYPDYKANRPEPPEDLVPQFPLVREAVKALNIACIEVPGYEADDLIAAYARRAAEQGMRVTIVSSDKDLMQLIDDQVELFDPMKQVPIREEEVLAKFGVPPEKVIQVQALIGDKVDNVPGVPGIGPKTAAELIQAYGDLEGVLANTGAIKQPKRRQSLEEYAEAARMSLKLVTLDDAVALPVEIEDFNHRKPEPEPLLKFLEEQNFKSLLVRWRQHFASEGTLPESHAANDAVEASSDAFQWQPPAVNETHYQLVTDEADLAVWVARMKNARQVAFDVETDSLDAMQANLVGLSFALEAGEACYIPVGHGPAKGTQTDLLSAESGPEQIPLETVLAQLKPLLESDSLLKIGQNIKYDMLVMRRYGVSVAPVDDTMVMSYVLDSVANRHNMDDLAEQYLGVTTTHFADVVKPLGKEATFADVPLETACNYAAEDADITLRLWQIFSHRIVREKQKTLYERIERPLIPVLVDMEYTGITVDAARLKELSADFTTRIEALEKEIYALAGREFTIGSPKQLGVVLFEEMGIEGGKRKAKSGGYGTGADILEDLAEKGHTIAEKVLAWRQLTKLRSTYTDALQKQINPQTGRVHTSFSMAVTSTGRLSSTDPNLQNIPIRTEDGRKLRTAFVPKEGCIMLSADYSQIELRVLASFAGIDALKDAFRNGQDIHALTASQVFGVPLDEVDDELRRRAKTINFGIIYGMSAFGLSSRLGISRSEAANYIEAYFTQYPGIRRYMDRTIQFAKEHGYVETFYGRRCHVRGIQDKNGAVRANAERAAINAPMQGTAADLMKKAMIATQHWLKEAGLPKALLLQVHDEMILEVPMSQAEQVTAKIKSIMESVSDLDVPLIAEVGTGDSWGASH